MILPDPLILGGMRGQEEGPERYSSSWFFWTASMRP
jgi:hypothetical protein